MRPWNHQYFWPGVLIVLGVYFLINNIGAPSWLQPKVVWPVVLIVLGVLLLLRRARP
jgi:uncharacterized membrane protein SirB2